MSGKYIDFFLGANTPAGFVSMYDQISNNEKLKKIYVIKGGAGTGKSSLMKKIGEESYNDGNFVERIHCSSDPDSLDAVIVEEKGFAILDGTPPHPMEPKYPGAVETLVNLYPSWDEEKLEKNVDRIKRYVKEYTDCHRKACVYLSVVSSLLKENRRVAESCVDYKKIDRYLDNLIRREFAKPSEEIGKETVRFFSAVTPKGVKVYESTIEALCDRVYLIEDDIGAASQYLLKGIRKRILDKKIDIICGYCVTSPYEKLEHIIVPQLKIGFLTSNKFHRMNVNIAKKRVKVSRFTDLNKLNERKQYIAFNKKAATSILNEAIKAMQNAKKHHDLLEECYIPCVNFEKVDNIRKELVAKLNIKKVL